MVKTAYPNPEYPIMIVDDSESITQIVSDYLETAGFNNIITFHDSRLVTEFISVQKIAVLILDLMMPHIKGENLLEEISIKYPDIPLIVLTGKGDVYTAVECMKLGAFDYLVKPADMDRLINCVRHALELSELKQENDALKQHILTDYIEQPDIFEDIITKNKKMLSIFQYIESIAPTSQSVLITGETGVGKELIAKAIHTASGRKGKMVTVNVAGLDDNMFSDTLFGHVKGAFTTAVNSLDGLVKQAEGGTLFLDEIGDLSLASQVKLLRLLQEGEYLPLGHDKPRRTDTRVLVATNRDIWKLQETGKFRDDIVFRLRTHHIHVPSLFERMDDIEILVDHFVDKASHLLNKKRPTIPSTLTILLKTYSFPGNVRELQAIIFDAVCMHKSGVMSLDSIKSNIKVSEKRPKFEIDESFPFAHLRRMPTIKQATVMLIEEAMKRAEGNQSAAARILGISQPALSNRLTERKRRKKVRSSGR